MQKYKIADMLKLEGNPRKISQEEMECLKESLLSIPEYLEAHPIVMSNRTGKWVVIDGNQRMEAARQLGWEEVPVALMSGLTEEKEREIIIRANVNNGEWDMDLLQEWDKEQLEDWGVSVEWEEPEEQKEAEEDDFTEEDAEKAEARVKPGEVWKLGEHRLMCGDSTDADCVAKLMNGEKADLLFTDPPYGVSYEKKTKEVLGSKSYTKIANDDLKLDEFKNFLDDVFANIYTMLKDTASYYIFSCQGGDQEMMMMMMRKNNIPCKHQIIWVKDAPVFSMGRLDYDYKHEPILYGWVKKHEFQRKGEQDKSVWEFKRTENKLHPTMKPVALIQNAILNSTKSHQYVLDVFGGSGSTLIACEQLNRKCFMMELDPHYCDVIIARWEKLTGKQAERIEE